MTRRPALRDPAAGRVALAAVLLLCSSPAFAQGGERRDTVKEDAVDAVTQPLSDLNLRTRDIPPNLLRAQQSPYDVIGMGDCTALRVEIAGLEEVLGPDADAPPEKTGIANQVLNFGGKVLGGFIPFRGVVRQLSGAEAEEDRWEAAVYSGVARRSFLKGFAQARECPALDQTTIAAVKEETIVQSSTDILGLGGVRNPYASEPVEVAQDEPVDASQPGSPAGESVHGRAPTGAKPEASTVE